MQTTVVLVMVLITVATIVMKHNNFAFKRVLTSWIIIIITIAIHSLIVAILGFPLRSFYVKV